MIRHIRAAWAAFRHPELIDESPEDTAKAYAQIVKDTEHRMCRQFADFLRGELQFWHERATK